MRNKCFIVLMLTAVCSIGLSCVLHAEGNDTKSRPANTAGIKRPVPIKTVEAEYSEEARRRHIEGVCTVSLVVDAYGVPQNVRVESCVDPSLDEPSRAAVLQYRFEPAKTIDGKAIPVALAVEITYHLEFKHNEDFCKLGAEHGLIVHLDFKPPPAGFATVPSAPRLSALTSDMNGPILAKFVDRGFCRSAYTSPKPVNCEATATISEKGKLISLKGLHCDLENAEKVAEE